MYSENTGTKSQKHCHHTISYQMRKRAEPEKRKCTYGYREDTSQRKTKFNDYHWESPPSRQSNFNRHVRSDRFETSWRHRELGHPCVDVGLVAPSHPQYHQNSYASSLMAFQTRILPQKFCYGIGSTPTMMGLPLRRPNADTPGIPTLRSQGLSYTTDAYHGSSHPSHNIGTRN